MIGGWRRVGTRAWRVPLLCGVGMVILQTGLTIYCFGETTSLREWVNPLLWGGLGLFFVTGGKAPSPACPKRPFTTHVPTRPTPTGPTLVLTGPEDFLDNRELEVGQRVQLRADLELSDDSVRAHTAVRRWRCDPLRAWW